MMGKVTFGISILALIISVAAPIFEYWWNKRLNRKNQATKYFEKIYGKYLFEDLPVAREYIHYDGNKVTGTDKVIDILKDMRVKSKYYEYVNKNFYNKFKERLQDLEDLLVLTNDNITDRAYQDFCTKVDGSLSVIYAMTCKEIMGM